jgi:hypothetical protein
MPEATMDGASSSYCLFSTDEFGTLRVSCPPQEGQTLYAVPAKKKNAVHKMARGAIGGIEVVSSKDRYASSYRH